VKIVIPDFEIYVGLISLDGFHWIKLVVTVNNNKSRLHI